MVAGDAGRLSGSEGPWGPAVILLVRTAVPVWAGYESGPTVSERMGVTCTRALTVSSERPRCGRCPEMLDPRFGVLVTLPSPPPRGSGSTLDVCRLRVIFGGPGPFPGPVGPVVWALGLPRSRGPCVPHEPARSDRPPTLQSRTWVSSQSRVRGLVPYQYAGVDPRRSGPRTSGSKAALTAPRIDLTSSYTAKTARSRADADTVRQDTRNSS